EFVRYFWHTLEPKSRKLIEGWPLEAICLHLEAVSTVNRAHMAYDDGGIKALNCHMPPPFQRREHHEQIGDAIAFVFVIVTRLASRLRGDRRARLDDQLFRGLVEAHHRT